MEVVGLVIYGKLLPYIGRLILWTSWEA